jgi:hypothetical protein
MITGAPGKAFLVNIIAKFSVGRSSAMSVSVIFAGFGTSNGVKSKRVEPTRKPAGNEAWLVSQARCSAREEKVRLVLGTSENLIFAARE